MLKICFKYIFIVVLMIVSSILSAQQAPMFRFAGKVNYFEAALENKHGLSAVTADWNLDGRKDLIVGFHFEGWMYFYPNTGSNSHPLFERELSRMEADGEHIKFANYT